MLKFNLKKYSIIPLSIAIIFSIYGIFLWMTRGFALSNAVMICTIIVVNLLFLIIINLKKNEEEIPRFIWTFSTMTYVAFHIAIILFLLPITIFALTHNNLYENEKIDYIVVHGSTTNGPSSVTEVVFERLNKAIELLDKHPEARVVLSGGKMRYEIEAEARYMASYLIKKGVERERILIEDKSYNTYTNVDYSLSLIENDIIKRNRYNSIIRFPFDSNDDMHIDYDDTNIVFLSSDFHLFRISLMVKKQGLEDAYYVGAKSNIIYVPYLFLKECLSLFKAYLLGQVI